jgi:HPt (histidine-containing phosphotransfer) domain-containing protein
MFGQLEVTDLTHGSASVDRPVVLDIDHLTAQALDDEELAREVLAMFLDQSADMLRIVRDAAAGLDRRNAAHRLKGSARAVGAFRVAAASEALEFLPEDADEPTLLERIAALHASVAEARSAIAARLHGASGPGL